MIRHPLAIAAAIAGALVLGACGNLRESLGLIHNAPDEFRVVSHEPLVVPDSLDSLPPPEPGTPRPQEVLPQASAEEELLGAALGPVDASASESLLLDMAGPAEPGIRALVDAERRTLLDNVPWIESVNIFRDLGDPTEVLVDPEKETRRLQGIAALGLPIDSGEFIDSVLEPEEKALLEGLL